MIIKNAVDEIQNFLVDASNFRGFCTSVFFPESTNEIIELIKDANRNHTPVTIAGNGTGLTGARVPQGGIVISLEKMNRILEINSAEMFAIVEPGVILENLQNILKGKKLLYPPDPTEKKCFIGATASTNASGEKTFKYGPTRNFITALDIVLPDGSFITLTRSKNKAAGLNLLLENSEGKTYELTLPDYKMPLTKNAAGYYSQKNMDAIDLFIGAEGTLGIITKLKLKLVPLPEKIISAVIFFNDEKDGLDFITEAREITYKKRMNKDYESIDALALEFFDHNSLKFLMPDYPLIPQEAKSAVWFEQEVTVLTEDVILEEWYKIIQKYNASEESIWFALNENEKEKIALFRHSVSAKVNDYISKKNLKKLGTDTAVPDIYFKSYYSFCKEEAEKSGLEFICYGHFGNSHLHLNMLPANEEQYKKGKEVYLKLCLKAIELGGTVSAEHGIGKLKREYLLEMYGEENIKKMASVKKALDPKKILNIGNIFEEKYLH
jgi:D-lactate dehydrogenase (cytochrome)